MESEEVKVNAVFVDTPDTAAGPGSVTESATDVRPLLEDASPLEYIEVLNPLSVDFVAKIGITKPVSASVTISKDINGRQMSEQDILSSYGIGLHNQDVQGRTHVENNIRIGSGKTINLLGDQAKVVVRQLVNEIMSREGRQLFLADPSARRAVEERLIMSRGSVQGDLLGQQATTVREQLEIAVKESNNEEFPELREPNESVQEGSVDTGGAEDASSERTDSPEPAKPKAKK